MRDSVPSPRYSPVCNVLRQWKTSLIPTYRVYTDSMIKASTVYTKAIEKYFGVPKLIFGAPNRTRCACFNEQGLDQAFSADLIADHWQSQNSSELLSAGAYHKYTQNYRILFSLFNYNIFEIATYIIIIIITMHKKYSVLNISSLILVKTCYAITYHNCCRSKEGQYQTKRQTI